MGVAETFAELAGGVDYPMYVVTAASGERRAGCLVGFTTQCSIHPPRFLACVSKKNHTAGVAAEAEALAVHLLEEDHRDLARLFGEATGDEVDKFAACEWRPGHAGAPVLLACRNWFTGAVLDRFDVGDHVAVLLEPVEGRAAGPPAPLPFSAVKDLDPGHPA